MCVHVHAITGLDLLVFCFEFCNQFYRVFCSLIFLFCDVTFWLWNTGFTRLIKIIEKQPLFLYSLEIHV